jgi:nitrate reductase NapE component
MNTFGDIVKSTLQRQVGVSLNFLVISMSPFSSVSIVSGYGLDDQAIEVRSLAGGK